MDSKKYYLKTKRPSWAPPSWLFGPVWSLLYILIFISFGSVFNRLLKGDIGFIVVLPFLLNIVFNILFTPIQWKLKSNLLASFDIFFMLLTLIWAMISIYPYYSWISLIQIPYLLWISFAFVLQSTITVLNWENERIRRK